MTQEDKDLLLKDLCARLPYGVKAYVKHWSKIDRKYYENIYDVKSVFPSLNEVHVQSKSGSVDVLLGYSDYNIKPYLFPLSNMTEEQYESLKELGILDNCSHSCEYVNPYIHGVSFIFKEFKTYSLELVEWLNENHFDYRELIPKGLVLDATGLNVY